MSDPARLPSAIPTRPLPAPAGPGAAVLATRGVLRLAGPDRAAFLQGLVSNDVASLAPGSLAYAALLSPQGKYLHDFFVQAGEDEFLIDCEGPRREDLLRRLKLYKLRSKIELADVTEQFEVQVAFGAGASGSTPDPRLAALGFRRIAPSGGGGGDADAYDRLRLALGVADGSRDMEIDKALLLENHIDLLHGVSWTKGCYVGQELTARTHYRGLIKKRLLPVTIEGDVPAPGTPVMDGAIEAGAMRSGRDGQGLALLRIAETEAALAAGRSLTAGAARLSPYRLAWMASSPA